MPNKLKPHQTIDDPDLQIVSSFGGLSSASYNRTGDVVYQDKLVNAYVANNGEIVKRAGSKVNTGISYYDSATGNGVKRFTFDNTNYMIAKVGRSLIVTASTTDNYIGYRTYGNIFSDAGANDVPSFAVRVESSYCHVLIATANCQMVTITIVKNILTAPSVASNNLSATLRIPVYGSNILSISNTIIRQGNTLFQPAGLTHSLASVSLTSSLVPTLDLGKIIRSHSFFLLRVVDAEYMPGLYMVNTAIRRNSVPLDVNVQVPAELQSNAIINEPSQDLSYQTLRVYANNTLQTKVTNRQPASNTEWDFSDGGYQAGSGMFTSQSPAFVSFGGLISGGTATTVQIARLRNVLLNVPISDMSCYVDKIQKSPTFYDASTSTITSGSPKYFSFASPGVNLSLSSVVELIHVGNTTANLNSTVIVNLDTNDAAITIGDGYCFPLYGYSYASVDGSFPDTVAFVGNRLVITGKISRVVFSNADWNYRGISFNNLQISSINFSETSAFSVTIGQETSNIKGFESVNGVAVIATDNGVYRISASSNANQPANSSDAIVTRVSNEIVINNQCFSVFGNRIYYASNNGLFALQYSNETQELVNESLSTNVGDKFVAVNSLSYVEDMRSFMMTFTGTNEILAWNVDTECYYSIKFATSLLPTIDDDGFYFNVPGDGVTYMLICTFDKASSTDLSNFNFSYTLPGRWCNVTNLPSSVDALVCPSELVQLLTTEKVVQTSGSNHVRSLTGKSFTVIEYAAGQVLPIDAYVVSKAFYGSRLDQSSRVASVNIMLAGVGSVAVAVVHPTNDYTDRATRIDVWNINSNGYQGEPMLNAAYPKYNIRSSSGDTNVIRLRQLGISEAWSLALKITDVSLLGFQFITNVKSRRRLR